MGILDDAIREHLELKRKHGAEHDEVERLEKEAFGPPERPGDPDSREHGLEDLEDLEAQEPDSEDLAIAEAETRIEPASDVDGWDDEQEEESERPLTPAEQARLGHPDLGETVDHPAVAAEPGAAEPPEPPETAIFDQGGDLDLDLDLDLEEPEPEPEPAPPLPEPELPSGGDDFDFEVPEPTAAEHPLARPADADEEDDGAPAESDSEETLLDLDDEEGDLDFDEEGDEGDGEGDGDDDLLGETPDFLQDTPEGERLWFEQGKPRDFDFDD